ncbi:uncharacterized protein LOC26526419 [Drosophila erecta]|uniref:uncharacterized protein LOC26526419 n=1 Tax=Drosophila erecta TaxID=7220 RepID=UPI000732ABD7|nr:uncharacterized protein LOC26526419 [Drosophila erecta]KQS39174.1 uncharacterized protein Dere_GG26595 [Drosophila erecta]
MSHDCPVHNKEAHALTITRSPHSDAAKIAMCACLELATCQAENCQLKQKLVEYQAKICSLEQQVATIAEEQNQILKEVVELRKETHAAPMETDGNIVDPLDNSSVVHQDDLEDENGYNPDSDSEQDGIQTSILSTHSSIASLVSLSFSSTSSLEQNISNDSSDSEYVGFIYSENEENLETDLIPTASFPEVPLLQNYISDSDGEQ